MKSLHDGDIKLQDDHQIRDASAEKIVSIKLQRTATYYYCGKVIGYTGHVGKEKSTWQNNNVFM